MEFRIETAGESHGAALTAICHGIPAGSPATEAFVDARLTARQQGHGRGSRQRVEHDRVIFRAGVRAGCATGNPIALEIKNRDDKYKDLPAVHEPRPGHADLAGALNRGLVDARDVIERASARETAVRVACGALGAQFLDALGMRVLGHTVRLGGVDVSGLPGDDLEGARARRDASPLHALGAVDEVARAMAAIDQAHQDGDTLGGVVEVVATGVPLGLGGHERPEHKLQASLAGAVMGIQAVKGFEVGLGFQAAELPGSKVHDAILPRDARGGGLRRSSNGAGGIEGGTSNGQPIVIRAAMKPLATLRQRLPSVDLRTGAAAPARFERTDTTAVPRLAIVAEAVVAAVLTDHVRRRFGGASLLEVQEALARHRDHLA